MSPGQSDFAQAQTSYRERLDWLLSYTTARFGAGYEFTARELRDVLPYDWTADELRAKLMALRSRGVVGFDRQSRVWWVEHE